MINKMKCLYAVVISDENLPDIKWPNGKPAIVGHIVMIPGGGFPCAVPFMEDDNKQLMCDGLDVAIEHLKTIAAKSGIKLKLVKYVVSSCEEIDILKEKEYIKGYI